MADEPGSRANLPPGLRVGDRVSFTEDVRTTGPGTVECVYGNMGEAVEAIVGDPGQLPHTSFLDEVDVGRPCYLVRLDDGRLYLVPERKPGELLIRRIEQGGTR